MRLPQARLDQVLDRFHQVEARMGLGRGLTEHEGETGAVAFLWDEHYPCFVAVFPRDVTEGVAPECGGAGNVVDAKDSRSDRQHAPMLPCAQLWCKG